jgi:hypothetical protein
MIDNLLDIIMFSVSQLWLSPMWWAVIGRW